MNGTCRLALVFSIARRSSRVEDSALRGAAHLAGAATSAAGNAPGMVAAEMYVYALQVYFYSHFQNISRTPC